MRVRVRVSMASRLLASHLSFGQVKIVQRNDWTGAKIFLEQQFIHLSPHLLSLNYHILNLKGLADLLIMTIM